MIQYQYTDKAPTYTDMPMGKLVESLMAIQQRKKDRERQDMLDKIQQAEEARAQQAYEDERQLKFAELAQKAAALKDEPKPEAGNVFPAAGLEDAGVPEGVLTDIPEPTTPTHKLELGGMPPLEIPLRNRQEVMRQAEEAQQGLHKGMVQLSPELLDGVPDNLKTVMLSFAQANGGYIPTQLLSGMASGLTRPEAPDRAPTTKNIGGREMGWNPETQGFDRDFGQAGSPAASASTAALKQYTDKRSGEVVFLNAADASKANAEGWLAPGPTTEQRNMSYQAGAIEPAFNLVEATLAEFESAQGGLGHVSQLIPGSKAYFARTRFVDQVKALLGAIVARQAGEGSRLSDEDRVAYSRAASLVNSTLMLPGGIEEARKRLVSARTLLEDIQQRRAISGAGAGAFGGNMQSPGNELPTETKSALDRLFPK